jgi:hypothetical protein
MEVFTPDTNRNSDTTSDRHILKDISVTGRIFNHNLIAGILPRQDSIHAIFRNLMGEENAAYQDSKWKVPCITDCYKRFGALSVFSAQVIDILSPPSGFVPLRCWAFQL